eukprot:6492350-Amphidinium_carterae.2
MSWQGEGAPSSRKGNVGDMALASSEEAQRIDCKLVVRRVDQQHWCEVTVVQSIDGGGGQVLCSMSAQVNSDVSKVSAGVKCKGWRRQLQQTLHKLRVATDFALALQVEGWCQAECTQWRRRSNMASAAA